MERLRYDKIADGVIGVDLHCGYTVIAMHRFSKNKRCYIVSLYLKDNTVDMLDLMTDNVRVSVAGKDDKEVNAAIAQTISELYVNGKVDYYIGRYKYIMDCFDYGNEYFSELDRKRGMRGE